MLNKKAAKSNFQAVFDVLGDLTGRTVADIGSGGGFFALRFAEAVGKDGKVYAMDTNPDHLAYIEHLAEDQGCRNIETILSMESGIPLQQCEIDLFFSRDSFHHISEPA